MRLLMMYMNLKKSKLNDYIYNYLYVFDLETYNKFIKDKIEYPSTVEFVSHTIIFN